MRVIRAALGRLLATTSLDRVRTALVRLCCTAPLPIDNSMIPVLALEAPPAGAAERFAAWEAERRQRLDQAGRCERRGLRLLARAALLRAAVCCEDQGAGRAARELRSLADSTCTGQGPETAPDPPLTLRLITADDAPADRPA